MSAERLPTGLEATALMRRAQADGGFAAVLKKGDPDRGALTLIIRERGEFHGILERVMDAKFEYRWTLVADAAQGSSIDLDRFVASKARFDPDFWLIELDIAQPERFIAETIDSA